MGIIEAVNAQNHINTILWQHIPDRFWIDAIRHRHLGFKQLATYNRDDELHLYKNLVPEIIHSNKNASLKEQKKSYEELKRCFYISCWYDDKTIDKEIFNSFSGPSGIALGIYYNDLCHLIQYARDTLI